MEYHIQTENLSKTFDMGRMGKRIHALDSLSLEVPSGSVMGFLGRNGAGKTTTIRILLGLIKPTAGTAKLMGKSVSDCAAREHVSYMPEAPALDPRDNAVTFFQIVGRIVGIAPPEIMRRMERVLAEVGLEGRENTMFSTYSRGMKQRFELAQALFTEPRILILDEPFSTLDPIGRIEIRDLILRYNRESGVTVFFSSHILSDVEIMCDFIGILDEGKLRAVGEKRDLLGIERIEVSGRGIDSNGRMFLEKMSSSIVRDDECISLFLSPNQDPGRIVDTMQRYGGTDIRITEHCRNLETFFTETVGKPRDSET
jgi:ABC-2 type transport system ATP-binding protein